MIQPIKTVTMTTAESTDASASSSTVAIDEQKSSLADSCHAPATTPLNVKLMLAAALVVGLSLRVNWAIMLPYNDAPDEYCHYSMVKYLADHFRPPTMADVPKIIPVSYPAMCPVGYAPLALPMVIMGTDHPYAYLAARIVNAILGTAMLLAIFAATRLLAPGNLYLPVVTTWLAALHPQLVFTHAYINNDGVMLLLTAILWWLWMRLASGEQSVPIFLVIGIVSAMSLLCKTNGIGVILAGAPLVATLFFAWCRQGHWRQTLVKSTALIGSFVVVCIPWWIWSMAHHESLFGWDVHARWWRGFVESAGIPQGFLTTDKLGEFLADTWESSWGMFGYAAIPLTRLDYMLIMLVSGIAAGSLLMSRQVIASTGSSATFSLDPLRVWRWKIGIIIFGTALVWAAHIYHSATFGLSAQGRYVLATTWPLLVLIAAGWITLGRGGWRSVVTSLIPILLFAFLQVSAVEEELKSNRFTQPDRRVRTRLMGFADDPPGRLAEDLPSLDFVGPARLEQSGNRQILFTKEGGAIRWPKPVVASQVGGILIEQQRLRGGVGHGFLRLRSADGKSTLLAEIPYHDPRVGMMRFRFDLRDFAEEHPDQPILIEFQPDTDEAMIILRKASLLGMGFEEKRKD